MIATDQPFILFDDARPGATAKARLYRNPIEIISAVEPGHVPEILSQMGDGNWAGFIAYEAGAALEPRIADTFRAPSLPLAWFARFEGWEDVSPEHVTGLLPAAEGGWLGTPQPDSIYGDYAKAFSRIQDYISAGDIYQANLTFPCKVNAVGNPLALYAGLRGRARAGHGGVVWTGEHWLLSLSPELFFAVHDGKITTRPMKGTATRKRNPQADTAAIATLQSDPKQRAENLMIVDLLRNDLSRVSQRGSVEVPELFKVETYPTIHTMTSTVTARLSDGTSVHDVLKAIFPCGSITGAPKIRAMEIIAEVEPHPRGAYTGSIGRIDAGGDAAFNVAIRTLHFTGSSGIGRLGLGSGIVADSKMEEEWRECLAKGKFVADPRSFDLIETMRFDPAGGIHLLDRHIERIGTSARAFGISFDRHTIRNELQAATFRIASSRRVRLMLSHSGAIAIEVTKLHTAPDGPAKVAVRPLPVAADDFRILHKTSNRAFYAEARASAGTFEVAFTDPDGFLTEGSFTNLFVKGDGVLLTPPLSRGLLPGVLRAELLANGSAVEADLRPADLEDGFFIGNASRGLLPAVLSDQSMMTLS